MRSEARPKAHRDDHNLSNFYPYFLCPKKNASIMRRRVETGRGRQDKQGTGFPLAQLNLNRIVPCWALNSKFMAHWGKGKLKTDCDLERYPLFGFGYWRLYYLLLFVSSFLFIFCHCPLQLPSYKTPQHPQIAHALWKERESRMTRSAKIASSVLFIPCEEICFRSWNFLLWFLLCATFLLFNSYFTFIIPLYYSCAFYCSLFFRYSCIAREKGAGCCIAHGDEMIFTTDTLFFALHIRLGDRTRFFDLVPVMLANII